MAPTTRNSPVDAALRGEGLKWASAHSRLLDQPRWCHGERERRSWRACCLAARTCLPACACLLLPFEHIIAWCVRGPSVFPSHFLFANRLRLQRVLKTVQRERACCVCVCSGLSGDEDAEAWGNASWRRRKKCWCTVFKLSLIFCTEGSACVLCWEGCWSCVVKASDSFGSENTPKRRCTVLKQTVVSYTEKPNTFIPCWKKHWHTAVEEMLMCLLVLCVCPHSALIRVCMYRFVDILGLSCLMYSAILYAWVKATPSQMPGLAKCTTVDWCNYWKESSRRTWVVGFFFFWGGGCSTGQNMNQSQFICKAVPLVGSLYTTNAHAQFGEGWRSKKSDGGCRSNSDHFSKVSAAGVIVHLW